MIRRRKFKAPEGYIYNGRMCLMSWEWAKKNCTKADPEIARKLNFEGSSNPQKSYDDFCEKYLTKWGEDAPAENRDD